MGYSRREALALGGGAVAMAAFPLPAFADLTSDAIAVFTGGADAASIMVLAAGNPNPAVATFNFGPLAAAQDASTRIRLAKTQDVVAVAKMADGSFVQAQATVKVTIGGCGG